MTEDLPQRLTSLRRNHPAWLLLASTNAPLTLACLQSFVDNHPGGIHFDDAIEDLAEIFETYANDPDFETGETEDHHAQARRELRQWLRRGLIVERETVKSWLPTLFHEKVCQKKIKNSFLLVLLHCSGLRVKG